MNVENREKIFAKLKRERLTKKLVMSETDITRIEMLAIVVFDVDESMTESELDSL